MDAPFETCTGATPPPLEGAIVHALQHRYGDGDLCLPEGTPPWLVEAAIRLGYLSEDGYLTSKGRRLLSIYQS